jgi:small subunit ribosomal protein S9
MPKTVKEEKTKIAKTPVEKKVEVKEAKPKEEKTEKKEKTPSFYQAVGRRKESTARVRLVVGTADEITVKGKTMKRGEIYINGRDANEYFAGEAFKKIYFEPFRTTNTMGRFVVTCLIVGGGQAGQLGAMILGISRALEKVDKEKFRPILKKRGFLMRDPRIKERRKAGFAQKARAKKQSPKR